ncbi:hypothetical protein Tsubulata_021061 [Turnera subulata]|uniref:Zinc knuckle CX2CX4HX4C domain-containing protein n=1 Tax=Turnera subulata TaxID=218843 RepID=A0A9Q0FLU9_9ROSI|nr:hypothetical protein Tsubulata_021061 [Turnera subulata]
MLGWQGFIRARIEIATDMPLLPGVACRDANGNEIWVRFLYERLGEICARCGRITHPTSRCTKPRRPGEGVERQAEDSYGPWMRAKELVGKYYQAKKQFPLEEQEDSDVNESTQEQDVSIATEPALIANVRNFRWWTPGLALQGARFPPTHSKHAPRVVPSITTSMQPCPNLAAIDRAVRGG